MSYWNLFPDYQKYGQAQGQVLSGGIHDTLSALTQYIQQKKIEDDKAQKDAFVSAHPMFTQSTQNFPQQNIPQDNTQAPMMRGGQQVQPDSGMNDGSYTPVQQAPVTTRQFSPENFAAVMQKYPDMAKSQLDIAQGLKAMQQGNDQKVVEGATGGFFSYDPANPKGTFTKITDPAPVQAKPVPETELAKYQSELDTIKKNNPNDPRIPQYQSMIEKLTERAPVNQSSQQSTLDRSYQYHMTNIDKSAKPIEDAQPRINRLIATLDSASPQADALVAPELLTVMAGGQGSGMRMNEAEIARIIGGRSKLESLKSAAQQWSLDPSKANSILPEQRQQIHTLIQEVQKRNDIVTKIIDDARLKMVNATDSKQHRQIYVDMKKQLNDLEKSGGSSAKQQPSNTPVVGTVEDGHRFKGGDPSNPNSWEEVKQ